MTGASGQKSETVYTVPLTTDKTSLLEEIDYRTEEWDDGEHYEGFAAFIGSADDATMQRIMETAVDNIFDDLHQGLASYIYDAMRPFVESK